LQIFMQWLPSRSRWWFLPLAIGLAALQFGSPAARVSDAVMTAAPAFQTTWSGYLVVLIFLCLLAAGASVAAGRAEDLPLLVIAGGCLVHLHVAQPLFVVPCALLAYAGLVAWHAARPERAYEPPRPWWRRVPAALALPWRQHPRAHIFAGGLLLLFVLPLLVDATRGSESNLALIWHQLVFYPGEHKSLQESLLYFLKFGAHSSYGAGQADAGVFETAGMMRYLWVHAPLYVVWLAGFGLAAWMVARQNWRLAGGGRLAAADRFLGWAGIFLFLSLALTLRWGVIQRGKMYYYNAFFNYSIYFFAALITAAVVVRLAQCWVESRWHNPGLGAWERSLAALATVLSLTLFIGWMKIDDNTWKVHLATHESVARVLSDGGARGKTQFLDFPQPAWPLAAGMALQMERAGWKFAVPDRWRIAFGPEYPPRVDLGRLAGTDYGKWTLFVPGAAAAADTFAKTSLPLEDGVSLTTDQPPALAPDRGGAASLVLRINVPSSAFEITGWDGAEVWGEWTNANIAVLTFPVAPVREDVDLNLNVFPFLDAAHGLSAQRLRVSLNGVPIGPELRLDLRDQPPIDLIIPKAVWNRASANAGSKAMLELDLPDAIPRQRLDPTAPDDTRALGVGVTGMFFSAVKPGPPAGAPQPAQEPSAELADASGPAPREYNFDGSPLPKADFAGISEAGWAGPEVTILLPRSPGAAPFLRLQGLAPLHPGINYPYRFTTTELGSGASTESVIPEAGPFDILVPLANAAGAGRNWKIRLSFPQTFSPATNETSSYAVRQLSVLLHSIAVTSAEVPVLASFGQGWYDKEIDPHNWWRWSKTDSLVELGAERAGTLVIKAAAATQKPGDVLDVLLDGRQFATPRIPKLGWNPLELRVPVTAGKHVLAFHSHIPGVQPPGDRRILAFGLENVTFTLE
jgi:hypothetical protein